IAQAEGATHLAPYCLSWMHNRHLRVDNTKMSKSLGNFYTLRDLTAKGYSPLAIRYLLLSSHYRAPLNFTLDGLDAAAKAVARINDFVARLDEAPDADGGPDLVPLCEQARKDFAAALDDDLNISAALAVVFDFMHEINRQQLTADATLPVRDTMECFDSVLDVLEAPAEDVDAEIERLIAERQAAREAKDFARADAIRDDLLTRGILLEDTPQGVRWRRKS
ncbi:cysteine--tRNA ligase, partial [bacterium]|nr:cysteine--tRNA ligase [bacterium]